MKSVIITLIFAIVSLFLFTSCGDNGSRSGIQNYAPVKPLTPYEQLEIEESALPIPQKGSHTIEEVMNMLNQRLEMKKKIIYFKETNKINQDQCDVLLKRNRDHSLGKY